MKNLPLLIGTIVGTLILVIGVSIFFSGNNAESGIGEPADQAVVLGESEMHFEGPEDATVTVVEFSDFQCPACKAIQPLVAQVRDNYGDRVKVVYRHFPLTTIHPYANLAAQASEIAAEEGKFWEFHDLLFERQSDWAKPSSNNEVIDIFATYAEELGIDTASFSERIASDEIKEKVLVDITDANTLNINSTPTLFVNNQKVPAPQLITTIDQLLTE